MSEQTALKNIAFLVSMGANIFFVAFFLGKFSIAPLPPPPVLGMGHVVGQHGPGGPLPPPPGGAIGPRHGQYAPEAPRAMAEGMPLPPPPPMFRPEDFFSPEEMKEKFFQMENTFGQVEKLRLDFAGRLAKGTVSKEEVLEHFVAVDKVMNAVRDGMQEKAAEKISAMTAEERENFVRRMMEHRLPFAHP